MGIGVGGVLAGISTLVSAAGSIVSGMAAARAANYRAAVAAANAKIARQNAEREQQRAQVVARDQDALTAALLGEQTALQGASGFDLGSPSARHARKSAAELGRRDTLNVRQAGDINAHNHLVQAMNFDAERTLNRMEARSSMIGGFLGAAGTLASGAGSMLGSGSFASSGSSVSSSSRSVIAPGTRRDNGSRRL